MRSRPDNIAFPDTRKVVGAGKHRLLLSTMPGTERAQQSTPEIPLREEDRWHLHRHGSG